MLLDIDTAIFSAGDHGPVIALLDLVAEGRHDWDATLAAALDADTFVSKLNENGLRTPVLAEWARKNVEEAANPRPARTAQLAVGGAELADLVQDLAKPAVVVVEDGITDECFVLAVARAFGDHRILHAERRSWLRFSHAGGTARIGRFAAKERRAFKIVVRVAALLDSDRKFPTQRSPNHDKLGKIREAGVTEIHMWTWCEVENYVPSLVWGRLAPHQAEKIEALRTMDPDQRGYLDIKKGLSRSPAPQVAAVFATLTPQQRRCWHDGLNRPSHTSLIPEDLPLSEEDFAELGPDAVAELRSLLAMIQRIL